MVTILSSSLCYPVNGLVFVLHSATTWWNIGYLMLAAFSVYTPAKAREHCYYLSYYVGCSSLDRNRYCTEYKKSWRTHSSDKQSFRGSILWQIHPEYTMQCNHYVISELLHSLVSPHVWRQLMNPSHPSLAAAQ